MMVVGMMLVWTTICFGLCGHCLVLMSVRCNSLSCVVE